MNFIKLGERYINLDAIAAVVPHKKGLGYTVTFIGGTQMDICEMDMADLETDLAMATRWRKVSEEFPEDGETVIVLLGRTPKTRGFFLTSRYVAGGWTYGEDPQGCNPTHWLRIPKAPEEEK